MEILSFLIIFVYVIYCVWKNGIPKSLSATYYNNGIWFSIVILLSTFLIFPKMLNMTPDNFTFLPFLMGAGISFVAIAPNFKSDWLDDKVHTVSAIIAFAASQIWIALLNPILLLTWIPFIFVRNNYKFWAELIMLLTIYEFIWK